MHCVRLLFWLVTTPSLSSSLIPTINRMRFRLFLECGILSTGENRSLSMLPAHSQNRNSACLQPRASFLRSFSAFVAFPFTFEGVRNSSCVLIIGLLPGWKRSIQQPGSSLVGHTCCRRNLTFESSTVKGKVTSMLMRCPEL
jgi:hypothetical protein